MKFFKAISFVMLWILLSFLWVSFGFAQIKSCPKEGPVESWIKAYPTLGSWYHFYLDREGCEMNINEFLKALAGSDQLSIRLNQAQVSFDQFYVPINNVLSINWKEIDPEASQRVQSDLSLIDHSLNKAMGHMNAADKDYFRSVVLLNLPTEFVEAAPTGKSETVVSKRLNRESGRSPPVIDSRDIASPPYEKVLTPEKPPENSKK